MEDLLEQLKQARLETDLAQQAVETLQYKLSMTKEFADLKDAKGLLEEKKYQLELIDSAVRQEALDLYGLTSDKHPHDKVSIAVSLEPIYQEKDAIAWAINNALDMLKIDTKQFEKHAKAVLKTVPLPFVKVEEKPMVKIAREL